MTKMLEVFEVVESEPGYMKIRGLRSGHETEWGLVKGKGVPADPPHPLGTRGVVRDLGAKTFVARSDVGDATEIPDPGYETTHGGDDRYVYQRKRDLLLPEGDLDRDTFMRLRVREGGQPEGDWERCDDPRLAGSSRWVMAKERD